MIERGIMMALRDAQKGSKQELQADALRAVLEAIKADGFVDPQGSESAVSPEDKLNTEWNKQTEKLASLFASELGLSREDYIATLPKFKPQPESYKNRFDIPVVVETRVSLSRMLELAGFKVNFDINELNDWDKFKSPKAPYTVWMQDGTKNLQKSVAVVRKNFAKDERGANILDGIALYLADPDILKRHCIDLPGSQVGADGAPCLVLWREEPELYCCVVDFAGPGFGSASCGVDN